MEWWSDYKKEYLYSRRWHMIFWEQQLRLFIERFFSAGSQIMDNRRNELKNKTLDALMCIYSCQKVFWKLIFVINDQRLCKDLNILFRIFGEDINKKFYDVFPKIICYNWRTLHLASIRFLMLDIFDILWKFHGLPEYPRTYSCG